MYFGVLIGVLVWAIRLLTGLIVLFLIFRGIYSLFVDSIGFGFMLLGAAVAVTFISNIASVMLLALGCWLTQLFVERKLGHLHQ